MDNSVNMNLPALLAKCTRGMGPRRCLDLFHALIITRFGNISSLESKKLFREEIYGKYLAQKKGQRHLALLQQLLQLARV